jgi:hypothetical protein
MKEILSKLKDVLSILEPYKEEGIKASSAYWETQKLISEVEKLVFAFPSGDGPGITLRQYAAIQLKVPQSGDADIDAMIRESRRAEFAGQALRIIVDKEMSFPESLLQGGWMEYAACQAFVFADAMLAELEKEAGK